MTMYETLICRLLLLRVIKPQSEEIFFMSSTLMLPDFYLRKIYQLKMRPTEFLVPTILG